MRKKLLCGLLVVAIAAVAAFNLNISLKNDFTKLVSTQTLEALSQLSGGWKPGEGGGTGTITYSLLVTEKYEIYVGGRIEIKYRDICKSVTFITIGCKF